MDGINATISRFGYPETLIAAYDHWLVLLRPEQPTAGSLVLAALGEARAFGALPTQAFAELARIAPAIELALAGAVAFEKLNYLMLMMVDPHVHFHVIPRYSGSRSLAGVEIADHGWPRAPQLSPAVTLEAAARDAMVARLKDGWA
jgi:diadenosine tetraphosphate (Ap4A) HIT family hydrolase